MKNLSLILGVLVMIFISCKNEGANSEVDQIKAKNKQIEFSEEDREYMVLEPMGYKYYYTKRSGNRPPEPGNFVILDFLVSTKSGEKIRESKDIYVEVDEPGASPDPNQIPMMVMASYLAVGDEVVILIPRRDIPLGSMNVGSGEELMIKMNVKEVVTAAEYADFVDGQDKENEDEKALLISQAKEKEQLARDYMTKIRTRSATFQKIDFEEDLSMWLLESGSKEKYKKGDYVYYRFVTILRNGSFIESTYEYGITRYYIFGVTDIFKGLEKSFESVNKYSSLMIRASPELVPSLRNEVDKVVPPGWDVYLYVELIEK